MKKLLFLIMVSLGLFACSSDDSNHYYYEFLPVESFEVPASFEYGKVYTFKVSYKKPTDCHTDQDIYLEKKDGIRTIAIQSLVLDKKKCNFLSNQEPINATFEFEVIENTDYTFKFYKGKDENGNDIFEEVTIPITIPATN